MSKNLHTAPNRGGGGLNFFFCSRPQLDEDWLLDARDEGLHGVDPLEGRERLAGGGRVGWGGGRGVGLEWSNSILYVW